MFRGHFCATSTRSGPGQNEAPGVFPGGSAGHGRPNWMRVILLILVVSSLTALATWWNGRTQTAPSPTEIADDEMEKLQGKVLESMGVALPDYRPLKKEVQQYVDAIGNPYGIFFKDLSSGQTWGVNEDQPMVAASTTKVPVVLYLNHLVAQGRAHWHDKVAYDPATDLERGAGPLEHYAQAGEKYSLRVLANLAITTSDNVAIRMLIRHLGKQNLIAFMRQIGGRTVYPGGKNLTTARDLVTYLEAVIDFARTHPDLGERLLDDLAHTIYNQGLPGQLPENLMVAHKEGELEDVVNDCGIVYGTRPFVLAVLSSNNRDMRQGFAHIAHITKLIYDYQEKLAREHPGPAR